MLVQDPQTKSWKVKGRIIGVRPNGRSYDVQLDSGKTFIRNRAFLRPIRDGISEDNNSTSLPITGFEPRRSARLSKKWLSFSDSNRPSVYGRTLLIFEQARCLWQNFIDLRTGQVSRQRLNKVNLPYFQCLTLSYYATSYTYLAHVSINLLPFSLLFQIFQ